MRKNSIKRPAVEGKGNLTELEDEWRSLSLLNFVK